MHIWVGIFVHQPLLRVPSKVHSHWTEQNRKTPHLRRQHVLKQRPMEHIFFEHGIVPRKDQPVATYLEPSDVNLGSGIKLDKKKVSSTKTAPILPTAYFKLISCCVSVGYAEVWAVDIHGLHGLHGQIIVVFVFFARGEAGEDTFFEACSEP